MGPMGGPKLPMSVYGVPGTQLAYHTVCHVELLFALMW